MLHVPSCCPWSHRVHRGGPWYQHTLCSLVGGGDVAVKSCSWPAAKAAESNYSAVLAGAAVGQGGKQEVVIGRGSAWGKFVSRSPAAPWVQGITWAACCRQSLQALLLLLGSPCIHANFVKWVCGQQLVGNVGLRCSESNVGVHRARRSFLLICCRWRVKGASKPLALFSGYGWKYLFIVALLE